MNAGFFTALADNRYDCIVFHDVDLLPENDRNMYSCPEQPRHMSVAVDELGYRYKAIIFSICQVRCALHIICLTLESNGLLVIRFTVTHANVTATVLSMHLAT